MSRDDGLMRADVDTSLYADPKVKRLWRMVRPDAALMAVAMSLWIAVLLDSWRTGQRISAEEAAPDWMSEPDPAIKALIEAGLLDTEGRIPEGPWVRWYVAAMERVRHEREYWAEKKRRQRERDRQRGTSDVSTGDTEALLPGTSDVSTGDIGDVPASQPSQPSQPAEPSPPGDYDRSTGPSALGDPRATRTADEAPVGDATSADEPKPDGHVRRLSSAGPRVNGAGETHDMTLRRNLARAPNDPARIAAMRELGYTPKEEMP